MHVSALSCPAPRLTSAGSVSRHTCWFMPLGRKQGAGEPSPPQVNPSGEMNGTRICGDDPLRPDSSPITMPMPTLQSVDCPTAEVVAVAVAEALVADGVMEAALVAEGVMESVLVAEALEVSVWLGESVAAAVEVDVGVPLRALVGERVACSSRAAGGGTGEEAKGDGGVGAQAGRQ